MAATAATSLTVIDRFSNVLNAFHRGVNQAAGSAIHLNQILQNHVTMNINVSNTVTQLQQVTVQAKEAASAIDSTKKSTSKLVTGLKSVSKALGGFKSVKQLVKLTIGGAMEDTKLEDMLKARTGNDQVGAAMFEKFKADALHAGTDVKGTINSVSSFIPVSKNMNQLNQFESIVQRLNAFDTTGQGVKGATTAVSKALSGDAGSLADNFNINKSQISAVKLDTYAKAGDVDNFLKAFNQLLEMQHMGKAEFEKMLESPTKQADMLRNRLKAGLADAGQSALRALAPITVMLNKAFETGKFQSLLSGLSAGLSVLANVTAAGIQFMLGHWNMLKNILVAVGVVLGVLAVMWIVEWLSAVWPVLAIIGAIALVLKILNLFGVSTSEVVGVVAGVFFALFAHLSNLIMPFWNLILSLAEFLVNVFIDPVYAIRKLFYDLVKDVAGNFISLVNFLIEKINKVADLFPKLKGKKLDLISDDWIESLKPTTTKNVVDFSKYKLQPRDIVEAYGKGKDFAGKALNSFKGMTNNLNADNILGNWDNNVKIQRVDSVGKIDNKVDISSEDLKVMRDLAEMKAVQNFVTLTPTLQVTTGDLHEKVDVDEMIHRIGDRMESAISSSAEGVFI